jgi:hypothetical protein
MTSDYMSILFSGLLSSVIAMGLSAVINILFQKRNEKRQLNDTLMQLNSFLLNEPFLENDASLKKYLTGDEKEDEIKNDKYNLFCIMKYNYLENLCKFYKFKLSRINKELSLKEYIMDNKSWWDENRGINYESYDKKFIHIIEEVINET